MADLFKGAAPTALSNDFLSEPIRSSFDNNGGILEVSNDLWLDYQRAAQRLATAARTPAVYNTFLTAGAKDAKTFVRNFGLKAYRRPLTDVELAEYDGLFAKGAQLIGGTDAFADGVELVVELMLQSPHFLYRPELSVNVVNGRVPLSSFELASRLSYGLSNTMPDDALFAAATANKLTSRDEVLPHAKRLLESARGRESLRDLHDQLFKLSHFADVKRDTQLFPQFRVEMAADMRVEAETFIREIIFGQNKGVEELLTAPYTYVNSRLAPLYGVTVPAGQPDAFVKVELDPTKRAGIYTQLGFLAVNATDAAPRSIMRGVHANLDILCVDLPAPPNVPPQAPADVGKTNRQLVEALTEADGSVCKGCHGALINPLGFAFENYDGLGQYRTTEGNGLPINASSSYPFADGTKSFNGAVELMKLIGTGKQAHECYSQRLFEYLLGRERIKTGEFAGADAGVILEIGRRSRLKAPIQSMILDLVATDAFITRMP